MRSQRYLSARRIQAPVETKGFDYVLVSVNASRSGLSEVNDYSGGDYTSGFTPVSQVERDPCISIGSSLTLRSVKLWYRNRQAVVISRQLMQNIE